MDEAVRALIIALIGVLASAATSYGLVLRARGESAKRQVAIDQARAEEENERKRIQTERDNQINKSLEDFRTLYSQERLLRIQKDSELSKLYTDFRLMQEDVKKLQATHAEQLATIKRLEDEIVRLTQRVADAEKARDAALALVDAKNKELADALDLLRVRNGELKEAQDTIDRIEQLLEEQTNTLTSMKERLLQLEAKKVDTDKLDGAKVPDTDPAITPIDTKE